MDKTDWTYIIAALVLILVTVLALFDKISETNLLEVFLLVIGIVLGGAFGYATGRRIGFQEGANLVAT